MVLMFFCSGTLFTFEAEQIGINSYMGLVQNTGISYDMFDHNAYGFDLKKAIMSNYNAYKKAKIYTYVRSDYCINLDQQ